MENTDKRRVRELIDRLGRIIAADEWGEDINPTQWTALSYLAEANRFSRSPSQVAEFMSATRGTVSQTLKALARKGLIEEVRSETDKRSISYTITAKGRDLIQKRLESEDLSHSADDRDLSELADRLEAFARDILRQRGLRPFGICETCTHNARTQDGWYCTLLREPLDGQEIKQLCHEHAEGT